MPLTDTSIRALKAGPRAKKVFDEKGLYLELPPTGGKWWRLKYYSPVTGKEKRLSLGTYPEVKLKDARGLRDEKRALIAKGIDPSHHRKQQQLAKRYSGENTFEAVTREWLGKFSPGWAENHAKRVKAMFERDVFPQIGTLPIADITSPEMLAVARRVETRALETAHRLLQSCGQVFRYGMATGRCKMDPTHPLRGKSGAARLATFWIVHSV